jgi:hypothetical protein
MSAGLEPAHGAQPVTPALAAERRRARRFAWTTLGGWMLFGLALEAAHGFKLSAYLDDSLRRSLLRLAHAHGVILALVVLAHGELGAPLLAAASRRVADTPAAATEAARRVARVARVGCWLRLGASLVPLGFALSAMGTSESDPSLPILLVPLGALALLAAIGRTAWAAWHARD